MNGRTSSRSNAASTRCTCSNGHLTAHRSCADSSWKDENAAAITEDGVAVSNDEVHHTAIDPGDLRFLHERLRRPASLYAASGSLPVLFFGDLFTAKVATVGLNPSHQEYLDRERRELVGERRRFETLASLNALDRQSLTDEQCARAMRTMRGYYQPGKPIYSWFRSMNRVLDAMGVSYQAGEAAHLDLVQEATDPAWSQLQGRDPGEAQALLTADLPFLLASQIGY